MRRRVTALVCTTAIIGSAVAFAQGRVRQHGRAIVEYVSPDVRTVANYEYSQKHHGGAWLLVEFAIQSKPRIAIHRDQLSLITPDERRIPVATQQQFLEDHATLTQLLQNASVTRRSLTSYFTGPAYRTIRFFASPGRTVDPEAATNLDEVAMGDLLFKSPDGSWQAGTYRLVLNHEQVKAEMPLTLE